MLDGVAQEFCSRKNTSLASVKEQPVVVQLLPAQ